MNLGLDLGWFKTRRPIVFAFFLLCVVVSSVFLVEGYSTNPYLPKWSRNRLVPLLLVGKAEFGLPNFLHAGAPSTVRLWCNVTTTDFSVGVPSCVVVQATITNYLYEIISVEVKPSNTILYLLPIPPWEHPDVPPETGLGFSTDIDLRMVENDTFFQTWAGGEWVEFQATGPLELTITIDLIPREPWGSLLWENFTSQFPDGKFTKELVMESIPIESGRTVQQQRSENLNLSLTYFVLFFASIDIAVAIYDHSEDYDRNSDYEKKKAEKKRFEISDRDQGIV